MTKRLSILLLPFGLLLGACQSVPEDDHFFLAKDSMLFEDSVQFQNESFLLTAIEPGSNDASGAAGTGCTSCQ